MQVNNIAIALLDITNDLNRMHHLKIHFYQLFNLSPNIQNRHMLKFKFPWSKSKISKSLKFKIQFLFNSIFKNLKFLDL